MTKIRSLLVLGGARSGKSAYAQRIAERSGADPHLLATAEACDAEMKERIDRHRADRGAGWTTVEEPLAIAERLSRIAGAGRIVVVDCLTLWLANLMGAGGDPDAASRKLSELVPDLGGPAIFVSNEVGGGIVPDNALARSFRDHQGRLNQAMASACDRVVLVTAGCPLQIKPAVEPDIQF